MGDYDQLPPELRAWLATALLPWRPISVRRAFDGAYARTKDKNDALRELDDLERRRVARDARSVWGEHYPEL